VWVRGKSTLPRLFAISMHRCNTETQVRAGTLC
jgi:hypothetical protein